MRQRYNENEYEWLRDVHDAPDRQQIKLFTFQVGQQELLKQKTAILVVFRLDTQPRRTYVGRVSLRRGCS